MITIPKIIAEFPEVERTAAPLRGPLLPRPPAAWTAPLRKLAPHVD